MEAPVEKKARTESKAAADPFAHVCLEFHEPWSKKRFSVTSQIGEISISSDGTARIDVAPGRWRDIRIDIVFHGNEASPDFCSTALRVRETMDFPIPYHLGRSNRGVYYTARVDLWIGDHERIVLPFRRTAAVKGEVSGKTAWLAKFTSGCVSAADCPFYEIPSIDDLKDALEWSADPTARNRCDDIASRMPVTLDNVSELKSLCYDFPLPSLWDLCIRFERKEGHARILDVLLTTDKSLTEIVKFLVTEKPKVAAHLLV